MATTLGEVRKNFETIVKAIKKNDAVLIECIDKRVNEKVIILCALNSNEEGHEFVPFAQMLKGNPYSYLVPLIDE